MAVQNKSRGEGNHYIC